MRTLFDDTYLRFILAPALSDRESFISAATHNTGFLLWNRYRMHMTVGGCTCIDDDKSLGPFLTLACVIDFGFCMCYIFLYIGFGFRKLWR